MAIVIDELNNFEKSDIIIAHNKPENIKAVTSLSLIVFFCSLKEVLLENFLKECMNKKKFDEGIQSFILNRNTRISDRINILFSLFTGEKWENALKALQTNSSFDYLEMANFCKKVKEIRNDMLHDGEITDIEDEIPNECYNNIKALISLFVDLHNRFIAK